MDESLQLEEVQFTADGVLCGVDGGGGEEASVAEGEDMYHHMMMDTGADEIVGLDMDEYVVGGAGADMPALGGEEEVLTLHTSLPEDHEDMSSVAMELDDIVSSVAAPPAPPALRSATSAPLLSRQPPPPQPPAQRVLQATVPASVNRPTATREVAIAPKPAPPAPGAAWPARLVSLGGKPTLVKKLTIGGLVQGQSGSKQLVMVGGGAGSGARLKLVPAAAAGAGGTLHYIKADHQTVVMPQAAKRPAGNTVTKVLVQGAAGADSAGGMIAKIVPSGGGPPRYITLQQGGGGGGGGAQPVLRMKPRAPHVISLKSPAARIVSSAPSNTSGGVVTKKVLVSAGGAASGAGQIHQINVPGKGVQYIRVVSNSSGAKLAAVRSAAPPPPPASAQLPAAPALVFTDTHVKTQQKLVRIAPAKTQPVSLLATSTQTTLTTQPRLAARVAQSLLAPRSPPPAAGVASEDDSKAALRSLVAEVQRSLELPVEFEAPKSVPESGAEQTVCDEDATAAEEEVRAEGGGGSDRTRYHEVTVSSYLDKYLENETSQQSSNVYVLPPASSFSSASVDNVNGNVPALERPRKACNCTKSQCLKLYCDCFANGEFCHQCNCANCHNNLQNEELRQKAIRSCLERNPNAFRPKIGKGKSLVGPEPVRRHNKGCNCKRSGCLKNYCECYEAKIACSAICRCVGCRNVEDGVGRLSHKDDLPPLSSLDYRPALQHTSREPCSLMSAEVVAAVCECLLAVASESCDPLPAVLDEFGRCLQDIVGAAGHSATEHALKA